MYCMKSLLEDLYDVDSFALRTAGHPYGSKIPLLVKGSVRNRGKPDTFAKALPHIASSINFVRILKIEIEVQKMI